MVKVQMKESVTQKCQRAADEQGFLVVAWPPGLSFQPEVGKALPPGSMASDFIGGEDIQVRTMCIGTATEFQWREQCRKYAADPRPPRCPYGTKFFKVVAE